MNRVLAWTGLALAGATPQVPAAVPAAAPVEEPDFISMSLEELTNVRVYSASKREQTLADAPSAVSIVTAEDIRQYGYRTLGDILDSVRGVYVTNDRTYGFLGVRGFNRPGDYGGRTLLLVDGHRINEALFDTTSFGHDFLLDVDLIDRVEVVRGPGSTLYGNNAFFSVVNVIPKRGRDYDAGELSAGVGSDDARQGRITVGRRLANGLEFVCSGTFFDARGERRIQYVSADPASPLPNGGVAEDLDDERAYSLFAQLRTGGVTLSGAYASRKKDLSTAPYLDYGAVFNDPTARNSDAPGFIDLKYEREIAADWSLLARAGYNRYGYDGRGQYDYGGTGDPADYTANKDWSRSESLGGELQVRGTLQGRHVVTAGAEYRDLFHNRYQNEDLDPPATYTSIRTAERTWGVFANAEVQLYRRILALHAGVRYDRFSEFGSAVSPRVGLVWRPVPSATFKYLYGEAYRTPNVYESAFNGLPGNADGNPPTPEAIRTDELVWEQQVGRHARIVVNGYRNRISDLIDQESEPASGLPHMVNLGRASARGVEFEIEARAASGLRGRLSYALQEARDTVADRELSNSPAHLAKLNLAVPLYRDRLFAGLEVHSCSSVLDLNDTRVDGFWLMDATLSSQKIAKGLEFSASIRNLFDQEYAFPATPAHSQAELPQPGRSLWLKLGYRF